LGSSEWSDKVLEQAPVTIFASQERNKKNPAVRRGFFVFRSAYLCSTRGLATLTLSALPASE
jgi:hypothetical protein